MSDQNLQLLPQVRLHKSCATLEAYISIEADGRNAHGANQAGITVSLAKKVGQAHALNRSSAKVKKGWLQGSQHQARTCASAISTFVRPASACSKLLHSSSGSPLSPPPATLPP